MRAHRDRRDVQATRDLIGVQPLTEQLEDLGLTGGERHRSPVGDVHPAAAIGAELLDDPHRQPRGQRGLAGEHRAQRLHRRVGVGALDQVVGGAGPQRVEQVVVVAGHGEHHDRGVGQGLADGPCGVDAAAGHLDVGQGQAAGRGMKVAHHVFWRSLCTGR